MVCMGELGVDDSGCEKIAFRATGYPCMGLLTTGIVCLSSLLDLSPLLVEGLVFLFPALSAESHL